MKLFKLRAWYIGISLLCLIELSGVAYINIWREYFWGAFEHKDIHTFYVLLTKFSIVALILSATVGVSNYGLQRVALEKRRQLTKEFFKRLPNLSHIEGIAQRLQEDCRDYWVLLFNLVKTLVMNVLYVIFYCWLITHQAGIIYLVIPVLYSVIGTLLGFNIAKPLILLNYLNQVTEAALRKYLSRTSYAKAHRNNYHLFKKTKHLTYFQYFFGQISVIFPYLLISVLYFSSKITFGVAIQVASAISHFVDSLSVLVNSFNDINKFLSCRKRLKEVQML